MNQISKQLACQKFIYKIHSSRLRKEKWKLTLPLDEARKNDEVISLADSQILRWIDELNGVIDADAKASEIKRSIKSLRKQPVDASVKREIKKLYSSLDALQFKPDYMCLIIDKSKDYYRACQGFTINGIRYVRLLGTNGGIKNSTIVFVSERLAPELRRRIENDRNIEKTFVTAKLEAYKALVCSASNPVSTPKGVIVVDDCETDFVTDYIFLTNEGSDEPVMKEVKDQLITIDASDGFGLMLPSLAERWSEELGLDYTVSGLNSRFSFMKGMIYTFDFIDFAEKIAGDYYIRDAWGNRVDVRDAELILTTSMVKLYDSYKDCDDYINKSLDNGYTFAITKTCPKVLENTHSLNYQFIQSFDLDDDDIDKLIEPTVSEIESIIHGDWRAAVLFLKGIGLTADDADRLSDDYIKAMMINHDVLKDPFVQNNIYQLIRNRINEAKVGVLNVHGNYSIVSGDPYLLCQSMFGLEKTGLLKAGEIYNEYWAERDADNLICFRAPMSTHANIRKVKSASDEDTRYWYKYIHTATIINGWDTMMAALNGMDFDGDLVMLTDNEVLLRKHRELPAIMCEQQKAEKRISTEEDFVKSNIASFGNEIGQITNWITSMYEVQASYPKESVEHNVLEYRIMSGQLIQQQSIDKAKGIIARPMPLSWHDRHAISKIDDEKKRELYYRIVADKKPYFMKYIYPALSKQYNDYIKKTNKMSQRLFGMKVDELKNVSNLTEEQKQFLKYYHMQMPVGINACVMNKICWKIEERFDGIISKINREYTFDYSILKSGTEYTKSQYESIRKLYNEYNRRLCTFAVYKKNERLDSIETNSNLSVIDNEFIEACARVCPNAATLCDIVLDICYSKKNTKHFAWRICGNQIIDNLYKSNNGIIHIPTIDKDGEFEYCGNHFKVKSVHTRGIA